MINILNTYLETYPLETLIQSWTYSLLGAHKLKESRNPRPLVASRQLREMESVNYTMHNLRFIIGITTLQVYMLQELHSFRTIKKRWIQKVERYDINANLTSPNIFFFLHGT
jgi:hypothetical protein